MWTILRKLLLGLTLIAAASAILLMSDLNRRKKSPQDMPRVALVQYASNSLLDEGARGVLEGLNDAGLVDGSTVSLHRYNAQADMPTANAIAREVTDGRFRVVITISTPCLQVVASANQAGKAIHVFGLVTDPYGAGVGITGPGPQEHPRHLVGIGTFQPVEKAFDIARQMMPGLKQVGVVWNPSEACSLACTKKARARCAELGIELREATVDAAAGVGEAAQSLIGRGVQAIWVGGDNTVTVAVDAVIKVASQARIPVFTNTPTDVNHGALFALGANYAEVGRMVAEMAADMLNGRDANTIRIENVVPERLAVNTVAIASLKETWTLTPELMRRAEIMVTAAGVQTASTSPSGKSPRGRKAKTVAIVQIVDNPAIDRACEGVIRGLTSTGLTVDRDFTVKRYNANGEVSQLPLIVSALKTSRPDLIVTAGTPVLLAAARAITDIPIVFTVASDPKVLKLFSNGQRPSNIVGVHDDPPVDRLLDLALGNEPAFDTVGVVWDPSQLNSEISVVKLRGACKQRNLKLVEGTAGALSELSMATQSVCQRGARVIVISADNLTTTGFPAIVTAARAGGVPVYATEPSLVDAGAAGAIGDDYGEWGAQSGRLAAKVLSGVSPADLEIEKTAVQRTVLATKAAPKGVVRVTPLRRWNIHIVAYSDTPPTEETLRGMKDGLAEAKLVGGRDYVLKMTNAQGDVATLNSIVTATRADGADMVLTISTPSLQAAIRQCDKSVIVFSTVASGVLAGAGRSETDHLPNVTGITTCSPFREMAEVLRTCMPSVRRAGTLFTTSELNSVYYKDLLAKELAARGIELVAVPVSTAGEIADAAIALCGKDIQVICQISDNLTSGAFASIAKQAEKARLPVFGFVTAQARSGAVLVLARDYYDNGREAALLAARIMRGEGPARIPFTNVRKTRMVIHAGLASRFGIHLPESLIAQADEVIK